MSDALGGLVDSIVAATPGLPDADTLADWSPDFSGEIDIQILADGRWEHKGTLIKREGLVRLFASLLRREPDGHYYLVTPSEKWRIQVAVHALRVIDCEQVGDTDVVSWQALLNTGGRCIVGGSNKLHGERLLPDGERSTPYMDLPNGLTAQIDRAAWYRLIESAEADGSAVFIHSAGERILLGNA